MNAFTNFKKDINKSDGFTAIELLTGIAILAAVAYLVLPLIFPSDSKTPQQYVEEDLTNVSEILQIRTLSAEANNIPLSEVYIGNLGVFGSKAQIRHAITIDLQSEVLRYCLRGEYREQVLYFESGAGILEQPSGTMECPGSPITNSDVNTGETGEPTTTEESPTDNNVNGEPEEVTTDNGNSEVLPEEEPTVEEAPTE
jgi:prepilin-type N-terminal cleavage/methylation domain-containing protein